jgi:beta-glucanase (GH16 family)
MTLITNGGTTTFNQVTVTVSLAGTGAIAGDTLRLYNGVTLLATTILSSGQITAGVVDYVRTGLTDATYNFNATIQNSNGVSAHSANYTVTVNTGGGAGAVLLFSDEFDTLDLKSAGNPTGVWSPVDFWQDINGAGYEDFAGIDTWNINPNGGGVFAAHNPFSTSGSVLTITSTRRPSDMTAPIAASMVSQGIPPPTPNWVGGILITNPDVITFRYGYFEARLRWPNPGKGMFPAWWLYNARGGPKTSAEIDILEIFGDVGNAYSTSMHGLVSTTIASFTTDTNNWHTYGMDWQPTYLRFYRDHVQIAEVTGAPAAWFDVPMGLRINFAMNAPWFSGVNKSDVSTPSPMNMEVDYVKVWDVLPF